MTGSPAWDASTAISSLATEPWSGRAWRFHRQVYEPLDQGGSLIVSGRYHQASDLFRIRWPALYLALGPEIALAEVIRHSSPEHFPRLNRYRLSEIEATLSAVIDLRRPPALGIELDDLVEDYDFAKTRALAAAAIEKGCEAILVPSATLLGDNLVLFPSLLRQSSDLRVVGSRDPSLYVPRSL